jgi:GAF domain-containing protein
MPKPPAPAPVDAVRDRLATLYRTAQIFNSTLDLDQVLNLVMDQVIEVIGAERGFLILRESDGRLTFHAARGMQQTVIDQPEFQVSRSIIERVATEGTPLLTSDAQSDDRFAAQKSVMFLSLRSILCVPLQTREKNIGVIYVDNRLRAGIFGENALELLVALANQAAVAIENARLFSDVRQKAERLALLNAIGADLTSTLDLHHVLESIIERLRGLIQVEAGSLQTLEGDELVFQIALGEKSDRVRAFRFPADRGCAGWSVQNRESVLVNDVTQDPRFFDKLDATSGLQTRAVLCAPMLVQDKVTGVIELVNKIGGPFTADDRDLLTTIAASAAIAIENARLYELAVDRGRLEREIQVAAEVQASLIPAAPPHIPGFEIGTLWQPARQAAGDFYDFVALDDDRQAFIVADVSDK